jgi:UDP-N-acetylglucosamine transferase subunit ALG13
MPPPQSSQLKVFVTVGAQMPFDRMVMAVDAWASGAEDCSVFAQIGPEAQKPQHIDWVEFLEPPQFRERVLWCDVLVAHAGMGSILTALEFGKPILVLPRRGALKETRNDHQVATASRFVEMGKVAVAMTETDLPQALDQLGSLEPGGRISASASPELIEAIRSFIHDS